MSGRTTSASPRSYSPGCGSWQKTTTLWPARLHSRASARVYTFEPVPPRRYPCQSRIRIPAIFISSSEESGGRPPDRGRTASAAGNAADFAREEMTMIPKLILVLTVLALAAATAATATPARSAGAHALAAPLRAADDSTCGDQCDTTDPGDSQDPVPPDDPAAGDDSPPPDDPAADDPSQDDPSTDDPSS